MAAVGSPTIKSANLKQNHKKDVTHTSMSLLRINRDVEGYDD